MKRCTSCLLKKNLEEFYITTGSHYHAKCKQCVKWQNNNRYREKKLMELEKSKCLTFSMCENE